MTFSKFFKYACQLGTLINPSNKKLNKVFS